MLASRRCAQSVKPRCCYREQARSHRVSWQAPNSVNTAKPVGAGLPAMQAPRSDGHTAGIPSPASPLPQSSVAGPEFGEHCKTCGSWLACDAGDALSQINRGAAIASKPAPTELSGRPRILGTLQNLWELACLRCAQSDKSRCCYREQARSHRVSWQAPNSGNTAKPVGAGLPAMQAMRSVS